jgi:hypothetical protein
MFVSLPKFMLNLNLKFNNVKSKARWFMPLLPERLRKKDCEFEASLGYIARLCLKKKKKKFRGGAHRRLLG